MPSAYDRKRESYRANGRRGPSQGHAVSWVAGLGLAGFVVLAALVWVAGTPGPPARQTAAVPPPASALPRQTASKRPGRPRPARPRSPVDAAPLPSGPRTLEDLLHRANNQSPEDDPDGGQMADDLAAARRAMAGRDLHAARHQLEAATLAVRSDAEREEVERVRRLLESLDTFWKAVRAEAAALPGTKELPLGKTYVLVVESSENAMTVRAEGRTRVWLIEDLPKELIVTLFERRLGKTSPLAHLHLGSFHAVDREGDRRMARRHWEQAGATGARFLADWP
jgi:hypothetical protein